MNILFLGDVVGGSGRKALLRLLPELKEKYNADVVIVNGENAAGGFGITPDIAKNLFDDIGVDVITSGNHIWDKKEVFNILSDNSVNLLRPANYSPSVPGRGSVIFKKNNFKLGVINLAGRIFMPNIDCPFRAIDKILETMSKETSCIIVDIHAEATSEKVALGWYVNGRVSAVVGTHTHVQTADERILPGGTAYITDIGMTGAIDSVIGMRKEEVIEKFLTQIPVKFETAKDNVWMCGVFISIDNITGKAKAIERIREKM